MKLEKGEYTTKSFIEYLQNKYGGKPNGSKFNSNDVAQYLLKGVTPYRYGRLKLTSEISDGIRIIKLGEAVNANKNK